MNRRKFLTNFTLLSSAMTAPTFMVKGLKAAQSLGPLGATEGKILVVVELAGGLDGLNTLVPFRDDAYFAARPTLALPESSLLKIDQDLGFHPSLPGFNDLYDRGNLAIVQGVGYPNPNRSHFRSRDIWYTAEPDQVGKNGWLAKHLDLNPSSVTLQAINIGGKVPKALISENGSSASLQSIDTYKLDTDPRYPGDADNKNDVFQQVLSEAGNRFNLQPYVTQTALDATLSSVELLEGQGGYDSSVEYPDTAFANNLRTTAQIISADLGVQIFYASIGGFDTHASQVEASNSQEGVLADLLDTVSSGISSFYQDLEELGRQDEVLVLMFSEFGRRVAENGSLGTDHGTANLMFLLGGQVNGGLYGEQPSLEPGDLVKGDLVHTVDFRSVYTTALERWLEVDAEAIIGEAWPMVDFL